MEELERQHASPTLSPNYHLWVHRLYDDDETPVLESYLVEQGVNFSGYREGLVQVVPRNGLSMTDDPGGTSLIQVTEYEWVPGARSFVATGFVKTSLVVGLAVVFKTAVCGRIMYYGVKGIDPGCSVSIYVSGFGQEQGG